VKHWRVWFHISGVTLAIWANTAIGYAQTAGQKAAAIESKSYVVSYVIVVLAIALGLLVVCRSGSRANEPKLDDLE
jgi:hypothetical protein